MGEGTHSDLLWFLRQVLLVLAPCFMVAGEIRLFPLQHKAIDLRIEARTICWWKTAKAKRHPAHRDRMGGRRWWESLSPGPCHPNPVPGENWVLEAIRDIHEGINLPGKEWRWLNGFIKFLVHWFPFTLIQGYAGAVHYFTWPYRLASISAPLA